MFSQLYSQSWGDKIQKQCHVDDLEKKKIRLDWKAYFEVVENLVKLIELRKNIK